MKEICFNIWNSNYERKGIQKEFKPIFVRYIGIPNMEEYRDILKTVVCKINENQKISLKFDNQIPFNADFNIINYINMELPNIDMNHIKNEDIVIFNNMKINEQFICALNYVIQIALQKENFVNETTKNNFITKLIIWSYSYLREIDFTQDKNPKCVYYGNITRHEIYFLILLYKLSFDVVFINPLKDEYWDEIDIDKLSEIKKYNLIAPIRTLQEETKNGNVIEYNESYLYQVEKQVDSLLYTSGVYKPWQLRGYQTRSITKKTNIIDLQNNWNQPAKVREGFSVKNNIVSIPCFYVKIDGVNKENKEYIKFVKECISATIVNVKTNDNFFSNWDCYYNQMYTLTFSQLNDRTFLKDEIKKLPFYQFSKFSKETQDLLLEKMNEFIKTTTLEKDSLLKFVMNLLFINEDIIKLIDNFDYANDIPKLIVFLENENVLSQDSVLLLNYLHTIGLDILIFNPSGMFHIENAILTNIRLDIMNYHQTINEITNKDSFLKKVKKIFK